MDHGGRSGLHAVEGPPAMNARVRRTGWKNMKRPVGFEKDAAQRKRDEASAAVEGGWWGERGSSSSEKVENGKGSRRESWGRGGDMCQ